MICSARLPVYVLVVAAVFSRSAPVLGFLSLGGIVIAAMYLLGFLAAVGTAFVLKRSVLKAPPPIFLMELPSYQVPQLREVLRRVLERCRVFVRTTGGIILALSLILWALMTFPRSELPVGEQQALRAHVAAETPDPATVDATMARHERAWALEHSVAGRFGHFIEPVISPLGFDWRIGIGLVASFAAREVLVSTLGQVYALDSEPGSPSLSAALASDKDPLTGHPRFTPLVGLSLMVFFVLALQCMSTFATIRRETNSWKWPLLLLAYMNGLAYLGSLLVYQIGSAMGWGT
jgi:ferrous iron transport protein B